MTSNIEENVELLTTGMCPLDCEYCYIPKTNKMKNLHEKIKSKLDEDIKSLPKDVKNMGIWGTEPALTTNKLIENKDYILNNFNDLETISMSTSMMIPQPLERLINEFSNWDGTIDLQTSLDGPEFITDRNRMKNASEKIPQNFLTLVNNIDPNNLNVDLSWKVTFQRKNLEMLDNEPVKIDDFINYFQSLNDKFDDVNNSRKVSLNKGSYSPTLAVPGKYTSEDGKTFSRVVKKFHDRDENVSYDYRLGRLFDFRDRFHKRSMFSCSGGDTQFGYSHDKYHICHRTFYYDHDEYIESVMETDIDNWDVSKFEKGYLDMINDNFIIDENDEDEKNRFKYTLRGYHDYWKFQINYIEAMMIELAKANQANERYLEDRKFRRLFGLFNNVALSCPMENLLNTGSIQLQPISLLRMFGNGAFEELIDFAQRR